MKALTLICSLPYNLSKVEKETLLTEAEDVVSAISELVTNGITKKDADNK